MTTHPNKAKEISTDNLKTTLFLLPCLDPSDAN